jgi:hypothetical protein
MTKLVPVGQKIRRRNTRNLPRINQDHHARDKRGYSDEQNRAEQAFNLVNHFGNAYNWKLN